MSDRVINLGRLGLRGASFADAARRTGQYGALPSDTDAQIIAKFNAAADAAAASAQLAEAGALVAGNIYATTSAGLAATAENGFFTVVGVGETFATLYQKVSGAAVLKNTYASYTAFNTKLTVIATFAAAAGSAIPAAVSTVYIEDRGARFKRVAAQPPHGLKFSNGGWWEIDEAIITAKMAGAKGDGVTDDYTALQNAVNYCLYRGAELVFTQGVYLHSQMIKFVPSKPTPGFGSIVAVPFPGPINYPFARSDSLSVRGVGNPTLKATVAMDSQFKFYQDFVFADAMEPQHVEISGMDFDGNSLATHGIYQSWASRFVHSAVRMHGHAINVRLYHSAPNSFEYCIYDATDCSILFDPQGAGDAIINGCDFYVRKCAIRMVTGSNTKIFGGLFTGHVYPGGGQTHRGLEIITTGQAAGHQARNITIDGVEAVGIDWLVYADDNDADGAIEIWGLNITNCHTIRNSYKPNIGLAYLKNTRGANITSCTAGSLEDYESTTPDIQLVSSFGTRIVSSHFYKSQNKIISIEGSDYTIVTGCEFQDCGRAMAAVYVQGSNCQVTHNTFAASGGVTLFATAIEEATGGYTPNNFRNNQWAAAHTKPVIRFGGLTTGRKEMATEIPTTGYWYADDEVEFYNPVAGGWRGAVCVSPGTPGTWKRWGAIEA